MEKILAGPILRRVEPERVCVWLASSMTIDAEAIVYENGNVQIPIGSTEHGKVSTVKLGDSLYVHLFEARPIPGETFPRDKLLLYDLVIDGDKLADMGLVGGTVNSLNYGAMPLPSFFIPTSLSAMAFGSCRKPHAFENKNGGNPDCLIAGDKLSERAVADLSRRPALLCLVGDQIYADDVATPLLHKFKRMARILTGWHERIPAKDNPGELLKPNKIPLGKREKYTNTRKKIRFSSTHAENHLLTFGEFASMYLFTMGPVMGRDIPAWKDVRQQVEETLWSENISDDGEINSVRISYQRQLKEVQRFISTLGRVRRFMANTPTYMICDDHEITDDWNITGDWQQKIEDSKYGKRIIANGLAAYWAFQAWGNNPDLYDQTFINTVEEHLSSPEPSGAKVDACQDLISETFWGFTVPTEPPLIFMDTRTRREFTSPKKPPVLLNHKGRQWMKNSWSELKKQLGAEDKAEPLIIISPTPVYGFVAIENLQKWALKLGLAKSETADVESWSANPEGLLSLEKMITEDLMPAWCVFLSGDVHYSFAKKTHLKNQASGKKTNIWQLTSSPLKNTSAKDWVLDLLSHLGNKKNYISPLGREKTVVTNQNNLGLLTFAGGVPNEFKLLVDHDNEWTYPLT